MRKKSHVTVQKWVDSISEAASNETPAVIEESEKINRQSCDNKKELTFNAAEQSISGLDESLSTGVSGVKGKLTEICNKLHVNDKLKGKKIQDLKNLLTKTTQKINKAVVEMDQQDQGDEEVVLEDEEITDEDINEPQKDQLNVQRACHISLLGRSSSENPPQRTRRLTDIGRSFSVAHDNDLELAVHSSDNLIYDADDETITIQSPPTSPSNKSDSNNHLDRHLGVQQRLLLGLRPAREHTVSEGYYSPQSLPKNQLLRDSSFQVNQDLKNTSLILTQ